MAPEPEAIGKWLRNKEPYKGMPQSEIRKLIDEGVAAKQAPKSAEPTSEPAE